MKKFHILWFLCLFCFQQALAHDPNMAYFTIVQKDSSVEITAEFPWTVRTALIKAFPNLKEAKTKAEFEKAFFSYCQQHIQLLGQYGNVLPLLQVQELPNEGHGDSWQYLLTFKGQQWTHIRNTMLFNLYDSQTNFHWMTLKGKKVEFVTTKNEPEFNPWEKPQGQWHWLWFSLSLIVVAILMILISKEKGKSNHQSTKSQP